MARMPLPAIDSAGVYFRMLLVGFLKSSTASVVSLDVVTTAVSLAEFLGYDPTDATPDHWTFTNTRQRLPLEVCQEVFQFVL